jgi:hypothetical protein
MKKRGWAINWSFKMTWSQCPLKAKNGGIDLKFQIAYDSKDAYFRFQ